MSGYYLFGEYIGMDPHSGIRGLREDGALPIAEFERSNGAECGVECYDQY